MSIPMPVEIDDVTAAFPANALEFMPPWDEIPEEFKDPNNPWVKFQNTWFSFGLSATYFAYQPVRIDGTLLDGNMILRQLSAIQGSYAPKHEHKVAAVAYLASLWMESLVYARPDADLSQIQVAGAASIEDWAEHFKGATA